MPPRRSKKPRTPPKQSPALDRPNVLPKSQLHHTPTNPSPNDPLALTPTTPPAPAPPPPPPNWPPNLPYLTNPILSPFLLLSHLKWLRTRPQPSEDLPLATLPSSPIDVLSRVEIRVIQDPAHPACGQRGLFATRDLAPGELVVCYFGYVHGGTGGERAEMERWKEASERGSVIESRSTSTSTREVMDTSTSSSPGTEATTENQTTARITATNLIGTWDTSSYDLNMYRSGDIEIAIDASQMGNEARFVNDYRGVPVQMPTREMGDTAETERRWRRKKGVKGWEGVGEGEFEVRGGGVGAENGDGTGSSTGYQETASYGNNVAIAMPNAEFRDVWFDSPNDIDLILPISNSTPPKQHQDNEVNDLNAVLKNTHLNNDSSEPNLNTDQDKEVKSGPRSRRKKKNGIRGVAVFVMPAGKAGKRKGGIKKGQEVLVSYGKGFWAYHGVEGGEG